MIETNKITNKSMLTSLKNLGISDHNNALRQKGQYDGTRWVSITMISS